MQKYVDVALLSVLSTPVLALEVTANAGWMSEYIFRGTHQDDSSAMGGIDLKTENGFYLGNWDADVGAGLETDLYGGYNGTLGDFTYGIGATGYFFLFPALSMRQVPLDLHILGLLSLLPLSAGMLGLIKRPLQREPATRIAIWTVLSLVVFSILANGYLIFLVIH